MGRRVAEGVLGKHRRGEVLKDGCARGERLVVVVGGDAEETVGAWNIGENGGLDVDRGSENRGVIGHQEGDEGSGDV